MEEEEETAEVEKQEEQPEATTGEEEHGETDKKSGVQKRINELTYKMRKQEREAEYWRKKAEEMEQAPKKQESASKKPTRDQFDDEDQYIEAVADWRFEQKNREVEEKKKTESQKRQDQERFQRLSQTIDELNSKGLKEFEDYDSVVLDNPDIHVTDPMAEAVAEMENGHIVAYHLGKNPEKSREIANKSPYAQAVAIAKLESELTSKKTKKTTKAPDPIDPVSGKGARSSKKPENMTMDEWMDWRYSNLRR